MGDNPLSPSEIERRLKSLTQRQCEILYWVCKGLNYKQTALKIHYRQDTVQQEMTRIYHLLGITDPSRDKMRQKLIVEFCPIHLKRVSDPETDCSHRVIEINEPEAEPEMETEVAEDVQQGSIPPDVTPIPEPFEADQEEGQEREGEEVQESKGQVIRIPPDEGPTSCLPWVLVVVMSTLLVGALFLLVTQELSKNAPPVPSNAVVIPPPSQAAAPSIPASSPLPTQVPYTSLPTPTTIFVVATVAPIIITPSPNNAVQNPLPGSMIAAGQSYEYSGLSIYSSSQPNVSSDQILVQVYVRNNRPQSYVLRYTMDQFHLKDDAGKQYPLFIPNADPNKLHETNNTTIEHNQVVQFSFGRSFGSVDFVGPIAVNARYLVLTIDQVAGMTNLNWQYNIQ
jgi:DNA-binding CsgD family transcriptional regulator